MATSLEGRRTILIALVIAACTPTPSLTFVPDAVDASSPAPDATLAEVDGGASADAADDAAPIDNPSDDAGITDASIKCGSTLVTSCAACPGSPLHCTKGMRNECVSDCSACAASWFPCFHCAAQDAAPHGSCLPVGANGQIACTETNLCACTTASDCPASSGAAETCELVPGAKGKRCVTCGSPATAGVACENAAGSVGVCRVADGAPPVCE